MPKDPVAGLRDQTIEELLADHRAARLRRDLATLGGKEFRAAAEEIAHIEAEVSRRTSFADVPDLGQPAGAPKTKRKAPKITTGQ